ncbi:MULTISPECIES: hypothetical protein [unclassified Okeania]|uniref:hypothetical protein n=1 Tax=unclassified Okeania TaxID=2634635 RepID=UPI0013BC4A91|nr:MULTISPECIES: hypothetical protein [unclassified Okeania]NES75539.1 hypothetical protein [Okeania sp. SIO1H4]NET17967.1 hypothetical protein [Okeania sp. SIO1H5]NET93059.1 hypothetical protein [Okeania sp. SIO1H2]
MLMTNIHKFLTTPIVDEKSCKGVIFWFSLSMTFATIYAFMTLKKAFASSLSIQDDARQHIFWMQRFFYPDLFPNDLIANYFQSVAPAGYTLLYKSAAIIGINPFIFAKIIPFILGLICTYYIFQICLEILPVPMAGFIAALVMNQAIWMKDDVASATPRAFVYPFFLAFLYYLLQGSLVRMGIAIALVGLFYPQYVFIASGILIFQLIYWKNGRFQLSSEKRTFLFCGVGLSTAFFVLLPYALSSSEFGPAISREAAMELREFYPNGRSTFFHVHPKDFWLTGKRSGMFPKSLFTPATQCAGLVLPFLLAFKSAFPLIRNITNRIWLLVHLLLSSLAMFFIAHALLFRLHLPSRYTGLSFRIIIALATAIALTLIIDALFNWAENTQKSPVKIQGIISLILTSLIMASLVLYPAFVKGFPLVKYKVGRATDLYEFFQEQPEDILIASLEEEANLLPTFAQRSILLGREYAIPYQVGYYSQFRQRTIDLIVAQYSSDLADVKNFIQKYGIDFWMLHRGSFTPEYIEDNSWLMQYEPAQDAVTFLQLGYIPALATTISTCTVFENDSLLVLDANCILGKGVGSRE